MEEKDITVENTTDQEKVVDNTVEEVKNDQKIVEEQDAQNNELTEKLTKL